MAKTLILACDGGGIRGYITASVLQQLVSSAAAGNFLPQVSLNAGTSTGSFISLALAAGVSIDTIQTQYQQANASPIFTPNPNISSGSSAALAAMKAASAKALSLGGIWSDIVYYLEYLINASYTNTGVMKIAQSLLGQNTAISALNPVLVNTIMLSNSAVTPPVWTPISITNSAGSPYLNMLAWEAALCSGAAPTYFPPYSPATPATPALGYCVDGGLFANNPSLAAIVAALSQGVAPGDLYVLSLDTGTPADGMAAGIISGWGGPLSMGPVQWLLPVAQANGGVTAPKFPLLSLLMDSSSAAITQQASQLLGVNNYFRVTVPLTAAVALDDTSTAAYTVMDQSLKAYYSSQNYSDAVTWLKNNFPVS